MIELLENPLIQLLLIVAAGMGLSWLSEREEQRRVAAGLPYRPLKERVLQGMGYVGDTGVTKERKSPLLENDIWIQAAKELELPVDKVLELRELVQPEKKKPAKQSPLT